MSAATRKTRVCTVDALDGELKAAIRAHGRRFGLEDIEASVLTCCETITVYQKKGFLGGIRTTLSAVYVTPKWLVWADSNGPNDVVAGAVPLNQIDAHPYQPVAQYAITPEQGLNITELYPDRHKAGSTFIVLEADADGQKFRQILNQALRSVAK